MNHIRGGKFQGKTIEILHYPPLREDGYYQNIQLAVDGEVSIPFSVPASARELYQDEEQWIAMLARQAVALIGMEKSGELAGRRD